MFTEGFEESMAMVLARRAYLYSLFHAVFGSRPTEKSVSSVFGQDTLSAFDWVSEVVLDGDVAGALGRTSGWQDCDLSEWLNNARSCIVRVKEDMSNSQAVEVLVESLRVSYDRLFQVPGEWYVYPWESPYASTQAVVFQESTLDVRSFYHEAGFRLRAEKRFPDDHVAAMMDYMGAMSRRAYEAFADGCDDEVLRTLSTGRRFADRHLLNWIDKFASKVTANDEQGCYGALAGGMAAFVVFDRIQVGRIEEALSRPE